jgi:hypothetical protein
VGVVVVVQPQPHLLQVVEALRSPRGLPCGLDGGQKKSDQHANDRNDNKQFNERKGSSAR